MTEFQKITSALAVLKNGEHIHFGGPQGECIILAYGGGYEIISVRDGEPCAHAALQEAADIVVKRLQLVIERPEL